MEGASALSFYETNDILTIGPNDHRPLDMTACVACGHCATVCPTGALTLKPALPDVYRALNNPELTVVAQIAPAVRAAFRQHYGIDGADVMPVLSAGLKKLGFNFVFDTCWAADLTIMEEGTEFLIAPRRGRGSAADHFLLPGLGQLLRKDGAGSPASSVFLQIAAADVRRGHEAVLRQATESTPGTALFCFHHALQRQEIRGQAARVQNQQYSGCGSRADNQRCHRPCLPKKTSIPRQIKPVPVDAFFGKCSGAGIIFGASGGVAEAALRLAAERVMGKRLDSFDYEGVRGLQGVKEATITLGDSKVRLAVVSGLQNAQKLIDRIRAGDAPYDLIEVMACPGGCINGSGNPAPLLNSDTEHRLEVLYRLDQDAPIRTSQDNPSVQAIYTNWLGEPDSEISHHALHTTYRRRSMRAQDIQEEPVV